jgi:hypothetical protein
LSYVHLVPLLTQYRTKEALQELGVIPTKRSELISEKADVKSFDSASTATLNEKASLFKVDSNSSSSTLHE